MELISRTRSYVRMRMWENANKFERYSRRQIIELEIIIGICYLTGYVTGRIYAYFWWHVYLLSSNMDRDLAYSKLLNRLDRNSRH